ncbi:MAG: hypothetical protein ACK4TG_05125, partial [Thermaurantiacus sp.]
GDVRSFEDVREELALEMIEPERERRFIEEQGRMFEMIFEDPSALEPIADAMGLEIRRSGLFGRGGGPGIASNREVVRQAFSDLVLLQGATSDPIEIGPGQAVAIRVLVHRPSVLRPVEEVIDLPHVLTRYEGAQRHRQPLDMQPGNLAQPRVLKAAQHRQHSLAGDEPERNHQSGHDQWHPHGNGQVPEPGQPHRSRPSSAMRAAMPS